MSTLSDVVPVFMEIAHRVVWCSVASIDRQRRPRSRVLHPYWEWDGQRLVGWIATMPTPLKRAHLDQSAYVSCSYWAPTHDAAVAECSAELVLSGRRAHACLEPVQGHPAAAWLRPGRHSRSRLGFSDVAGFRGPAPRAMAAQSAPRRGVPQRRLRRRPGLARRTIRRRGRRLSPA